MLTKRGGPANVPQPRLPSTFPPTSPPHPRSLARNQFSNQAERWPGLWDIPVWELSALGGAYEMDYGEGG